MPFPPAQAVTAAKTAKPGQAPAAKKPSKPMQFESLFGIGLLSVAGLAAVIAGGWYWLRASQSARADAASGGHSSRSRAAAESSSALPQLSRRPDSACSRNRSCRHAGKTRLRPEAKPGTASSQSRLNHPRASPLPPKQQPPRRSPSPFTPPPAPATKPAPATNPTPAKTQPPAPAASTAFDPRKADPNKNGKLKIDVSKFPKGLPFTVAMNNKSYIHFITGDGSNLDNLFAPPGMQQFQVSFKSGGQEWDSKPLSSDFKAKKGKTLKVQLLENGTAKTRKSPCRSARTRYCRSPSTPASAICSDLLSL